MRAEITLLPNTEVDAQPQALFSSVPDVCSVDNVKDALGVTANTVRELLRSGQLRGFKVGQHWRITRTAILEFIDAQERALIEGRGVNV